jgi:hypothetical protein
LLKYIFEEVLLSAFEPFILVVDPLMDLSEAAPAPVNEDQITLVMVLSVIHSSYLVVIVSGREDLAYPYNIRKIIC